MTNAGTQTELNQLYTLEPTNNMRKIKNNNSQQSIDDIINKLNLAKVDRRFTTLYSEKCCKPYLLLSFRNNAFCNDTTLNLHFPNNYNFYEALYKRYTYIIELELLDTFINEDIAIYKIVNTPQEIIDRLPSVVIDTKLYDSTSISNLFCLQAAPYDNFGRIINDAKIEGVLDNFCLDGDLLGNTYIYQGLRYLVKGFFRFGSSGAPYLIYDEENQIFKANAVQSQASFIQMSINNNMEGNRQYINGIASPLFIIEEQLRNRIAELA